MPEPMDYFGACSRTSVCEAKCNTDISAFDEERGKHSNPAGNVPTVITSVQESMFFTELNEDAYMPMKIVSMVELSDCAPICGGSTVASQEEAQSTEFNKDTCIAIAGIPVNNTIQVRKYCVPKALGLSVRSEPFQTWSVWFSEEWSSTLIDLKFAETVTGDTLIALRDNRGRSIGVTGPVAEQFVTVHPRSVQKDPYEYSLNYGNQQHRSTRFVAATHATVLDAIITDALEQRSQFSTTTTLPTISDILAITEMFVIPATDNRKEPWLFLEVVIISASSSITASNRRTVCTPLDVDIIIQSRATEQQFFQPCSMSNFFQLNRDGSYIPVVMTAIATNLETNILLVPTIKGWKLLLLTVTFYDAKRFKRSSTVSFNTPDSFTSGAKFPTRAPWSDVASSTFLGANAAETARTGTVVTQEGVATTVTKQLSQNSLIATVVPQDDEDSTTVSFFCTADPDAMTHWLNRVRIYISVESGGDAYTVISSTHSSQRVNVAVTVLNSCDRSSCLGCQTLKLQALCYTAQNCVVTRCIGTVVSQNRPLCNLGLTIQSLTEESITLTLGAWLVFTETYTQILRLSLDKTSQVIVYQYSRNSHACRRGT